MASIRRVDFDPKELIASAVSLLRPAAQTKGLTIEAMRDQALPSLLIGDPGRLRQVLLNLLGNAIKFTERGLRAGLSFSSKPWRRSGRTADRDCGLRPRDSG
ncbi:MAG TPA: hypothetical protein VN915_17390 [Elusimicrobiota bacterium]|nr:hypothetical protein [Elusimicrobiota bacterium]